MVLSWVVKLPVLSYVVSCALVLWTLVRFDCACYNVVSSDDAYCWSVVWKNRIGTEQQLQSHARCCVVTPTRWYRITVPSSSYALTSLPSLTLLFIIVLDFRLCHFILSSKVPVGLSSWSCWVKLWPAHCYVQILSGETCPWVIPILGSQTTMSLGLKKGQEFWNNHVLRGKGVQRLLVLWQCCQQRRIIISATNTENSYPFKSLKVENDQQSCRLKAARGN